MSSWLDTKYLGSLAKNALAEAQKTLDKALDIKEDDEDQETVISEPVFSQENGLKPTAPVQDQPPTRSGSTSNVGGSLVKSFSNNLGVSGWGSFTGSFFGASELGKEKLRNEEEQQKRQRSKERRTVVHSSSEPVSLQPTSNSSLLNSSVAGSTGSHPVKANSEISQNLAVRHEQQQPAIPLSMSSSIMEASCESDVLELQLQQLQPDVGSRQSDSADILVADELDNSSRDLIITKQTSAAPLEVFASKSSTEIDSDKIPSSSVLNVSSDQPVSLSSVSSVSGLVSSMTDDSEDLNSSVSSSQTCVPVSASTDLEASTTTTSTTFIIDPDDDRMEEVEPTLANSLINDNTITNAWSNNLRLEEVEPETTIITGNESAGGNLLMESVITHSLIEDALVESDEASSSVDGHQPVESNSQGIENFLDEKRCDSDLGSQSSKSFELLKMPVSVTIGHNHHAGGGGGGHSAGSGHTSGDDLETFTTNSSDIEVISSPGYSEKSSGPGLAGAAGGSPVSSSKRGRADGSNNRHFKQGHFRTCSELSSVSCLSEACDSAETDRLLKKIAELTEILEARETKMVELSRSNLELQEQNVDLTSQVKEAMKINSKMSEAALSSEEFTQRMAAIEKKLQTVTAERDTLKEENKVLKKDRVSHKELAKLLAEKDDVINDLREEGESLSKQAGKHSEIIKKLRTKEKSLEKELSSTKTSLEEKIKECDRLKKSLSAKDEVEAKQIEAIRELTIANGKWEEANKKMASDLEDAHEKVNGLRLSLETAYKEMGDLKRGLMEAEDEAKGAQLAKEIEAREKLSKQAREDLENFRAERDALCREIDELRVALSAEERSAARREEEMRRERQELQQRLEQSEHRHEELSGSVSLATRPLLRQIESLQASLSETRSNSDRVEQSLTERLQQTSLQLAAAQERERTAADQYRQVSARAATLESQLSNLLRLKSELEVKLEAESRKLLSLEEQRAKEVAVNEALKKSFAEEISELKKEKDILEAGLDNERSLLVGEQRKNVALVQQLKDRDKRIRDIQSEFDVSRSVGIEPRYSEKSSPTPSLSQLSIGGSFSEHNWPDDAFDSYSGNGRNSVVFASGPVYETGRAAGGSMTALLESLQSQLKQREGELVQLQMEVSGLERIKEGLTQELGRLTQREEQLEHVEEELKQMRQSYAETEQKYQTLLTMYGEKVEEAEELKLDLLDVKEMYKVQIEEVLRVQQKQMTS